MKRIDFIAESEYLLESSFTQCFSICLWSQGDKVVKMNIDGVDASIEGIVQCDVPSSWASLKVESEAGAKWNNGDLFF